MKHLLNFVLVFSLAIPSPSLLAKKSSHRKGSGSITQNEQTYLNLSDYVLTLNQVRELSDEDKVAYFYFMNRSMELISVILERQQAFYVQNSVEQKKFNELQSRFQFLLNVDELFLPKAHAKSWKLNLASWFKDNVAKSLKPKLKAMGKSFDETIAKLKRKKKPEKPKEKKEPSFGEKTDADSKIAEASRKEPELQRVRVHQGVNGDRSRATFTNETTSSVTNRSADQLKRVQVRPENNGTVPTGQTLTPSTRSAKIRNPKARVRAKEDLKKGKFRYTNLNAKKSGKYRTRARTGAKAKEKQKENLSAESKAAEKADANPKTASKTKANPSKSESTKSQAKSAAKAEPKPNNVYSLSSRRRNRSKRNNTPAAEKAQTAAKNKRTIGAGAFAAGTAGLAVASTIGSGEAGIQQDPQQQTDNSESPPAPTEQEVEKPRLKTGTCIIANQISEYREKEGANYCKETNLKKCSEKGEIQCGTYGLVMKACVPRRPLEGLSARCAKKVTDVMDDVIENKVKLEVDIEAYDDWERAVRKVLKDFENSKDGNNKSFKEYCANRSEDFAQSAECNAMKEAIAHLKNQFPGIRAQVLANHKKELEIAKRIAAEKERSTFMDQKSSCQYEKLKATEYCIACGIGLTEELKNNPPSNTYLEMLRVLAVQCEGNNAKKFAENSLAVSDRVAKMISAIGYCETFQGEDNEAYNDLRENHFKNLTKGTASLDDEKIAKLFEETYGMEPSEAKQAFCGEGSNDFSWDDPYKIQKNYNQKMYKNRTKEKDSRKSLRVKSGWAKCDTEIQLSQNRPIIEGVPARLARQKTKEYNERDEGANYFTRTIHRDHIKPNSGLVSWNPTYSGMTDENGKNREAVDRFSLINYGTEPGQKKFKQNEISDYRNYSKAAPIRDNVSKAKTLKDELLYACGGNRPTSHWEAEKGRRQRGGGAR